MSGYGGDLYVKIRPDQTDFAGELQVGLTEAAAKAGASAGTAYSAAFQAKVAQMTPSAQGLLQRSGIGAELQGIRNAQGDLNRANAQIAELETTTAGATRQASGLSMAMRGVGFAVAGALAFGAVKMLTEGLQDAKGAAGDLGMTLHGLQTFDLAESLTGTAQLIKDLDDATGNWLSTFNDGVNNLANFVIPGLGDKIGGLENTLANGDQTKAYVAGQLATNTQAVLQAQVGGAGNDVIRGLLRDRQSALRDALGVVNPASPFQSSAEDRRRTADLLRQEIGGKAFEAMQRELIQVNDQLKRMNRPLPVQANEAVLSQLSVARATSDVQGQRAALALLIQQFTRQIDNPNLTDKQRQGVADELTSFKAALKQVNDQAAKQTTTETPTPFGVRRQADLAVQQAQATGDQEKIIAARRQQIELDDRYIRIQTDLLHRGGANAGAHADTLKRLYADRASAQSEIDGIERARQAAEDAAARDKAAAAARAAQEAQRRQSLYEQTIATELAALKVRESKGELAGDPSSARAALQSFLLKEIKDARLPDSTVVALRAELVALEQRRVRTQDQAQTAADALRKEMAAAVSTATRTVGGIVDGLTKDLQQQVVEARQIREAQLVNDVAAAGLTKRTTDDRTAIQAQIDYWRMQVRETEGLERQRARAQLIAARAAMQGLAKRDQGSGGFTLEQFYASALQDFQRFGSNISTTGLLAPQDVRGLIGNIAVGRDAPLLTVAGQQLEEARKQTALMERGIMGAAGKIAARGVAAADEAVAAAIGWVGGQPKHRAVDQARIDAWWLG